MKKSAQNKKGFTLIESLVAVAIVLVAVSATFAAAQGGISSENAVRNQITAVFLAQEALEGVKNIKDSNLLEISSNGPTINWLQGITVAAGGGSGPCPTSATPCAYDINTGDSQNTAALDDCGVNQCKVEMDSSLGVYHQTLLQDSSRFTDTGFVRKIYVTETQPGGSEVKVRVEITRPAQPTFKYEIVDVMYNWF